LILEVLAHAGEVEMDWNAEFVQDTVENGEFTSN
jgi:hypothetical protein